jgi:uncharacterized protein YbjT (DUF2867 family)
MDNELVLVTGGTGTLGRHVVPRLRDAGCTIRVLSRHGGDPADGVEHVVGDLATGDGVDEAVRGAGVVVHLAGSSKGDEEKARSLVGAASRSGVRHLVFVSVVGADRVPVASGLDRAMFGYFASKLGAERVIADSGLPWTTLRATQFHDLLLQTFRQMARMPIVPVPSRFRMQPVASAEVAEHLVELALGDPAGLVGDVAGPEVHTMGDLLRTYLRAAGKHRLLLPMRVPGRAAAAHRAGANLAPERAVGRITWEDFLADRLDVAARPITHLDRTEVST